MSITIPFGDNRDINIYYRDEKGRASNLTGATVDYIIAATDSYTATPALTLSTTTYKNESGTSVPLDGSGVATVTISTAQTTTLGVGRFYGYAKVTDSLGSVTKSRRGEFVIE